MDVTAFDPPAYARDLAFLAAGLFDGPVALDAAHAAAAADAAAILASDDGGDGPFDEIRTSVLALARDVDRNGKFDSLARSFQFDDARSGPLFAALVAVDCAACVDPDHEPRLPEVRAMRDVLPLPTPTPALGMWMG